MSILFSRQCEYALQATMYLALKKPGEMTPMNELAKRLDIPYHFVSKILQRLARKGLLVSMKGPLGGFSLGIPAKDITLFHVVEAIDGASFMNSCVLGFSECSGKSPCSVHDRWGTLRESLHSMHMAKNIAEMASSTRKSSFRNA